MTVSVFSALRGNLNSQPVTLFDIARPPQSPALSWFFHDLLAHSLCIYASSILSVAVFSVPRLRLCLESSVGWWYGRIFCFVIDYIDYIHVIYGSRPLCWEEQAWETACGPRDLTKFWTTNFIVSSILPHRHRICVETDGCLALFPVLAMLVTTDLMLRWVWSRTRQVSMRLSFTTSSITDSTPSQSTCANLGPLNPEVC